jgi:peptidoglycan pentaglycine glycine transferase (the first glycine)
MSELSRSQWEAFTTQHPDTHFLQTSAWGELKNIFGWRVARVQKGSAGAQILFRSVLPGLTLAYIPKGPIGLSSPVYDEWDEFVQEVDQICKKNHAFLLQIEPDTWETFPLGETSQFNAAFPVEPFTKNEAPAGFIHGSHSIQPMRTILIDLNGTEDLLLSRMKQKTRYNIRLAQKSGITVTASSDLELFSRMMNETGERDQFGVHSTLYYKDIYDLFHPRGECELLLASFQAESLAMILVMRSGNRAWYLYGASRSAHREKMPTYLLQWEAIRWAKNRQCISYDLWGVPDEKEETLEANFTTRSSGLWAVYRFKRGFGGALLRSAGPWDRVYNPLLYQLYCYWMKRSLRGESQ